MTAMFIILTLQAFAGAFDNFWHHELEAKLPSRISARYELTLHAAREAIYAVLFAGLAWLRWEGAWAWVLTVLLVVEVAITLADFIEEDLTRRLPPLERVLHTALAVSYGAFTALLAPTVAGWAAQPSALAPVSYGWWSPLFTLYAAGVFAWSVRNVLAVVALHRRVAAGAVTPMTGPQSGPVTLVTGGTGFIGSALVARLRADGRRVVVLSRDARRAAATFGPGVQIVETLDAIPAEMPVETIVNLAGAPVLGGRWTRRRRAVLLGSRRGTTAVVVALAARLRTPPAVLVSASATGFYGASDDAAPCDEAAAPRPGQFGSDLCRLWEDAARRAEALGIRTVRLRLGIVLGRHGGPLPALAFATRCGLGAVLGGGRQPVPWIGLQDAVELILFAIDQPELDGAVNTVAPECVDQQTLAHTLADVLHRRVRLHVPATPLRAVLGEAAGLLLKGRPVLPRAALAAGFVFQHPTLRAALGAALAEVPRGGAASAINDGGLAGGAGAPYGA